MVSQLTTGSTAFRTLLTQAIVLISPHKLDEALAALNHALAIDDKSTLALSMRAMTRKLKGETPQALADIDQALALDGRNSELHDSRGTRDQRCL